MRDRAADPARVVQCRVSVCASHLQKDAATSPSALTFLRSCQIRLSRRSHMQEPLSNPCACTPRFFPGRPIPSTHGQQRFGSSLLSGKVQKNRPMNMSSSRPECPWQPSLCPSFGGARQNSWHTLHPTPRPAGFSQTHLAVGLQD